MPMPAKTPPVHPGEILLEEFLKPLGLSQYRLAKDIGVPPRRINEIVLGKRGLTADTALRLARYFRNSPRFWLNLQSQHDLELQRDRLGDRLDREVPRLARPASTLGSGRHTDLQAAAMAVPYRRGSND